MTNPAPVLSLPWQPVHRRRHAGAPGAPGTMWSGEIAVNETDANGLSVYWGAGDDGSGNATSKVAIAGAGAFMDLASAQTVGGLKNFSIPPVVGTLPGTDISQGAASTAFVKGIIGWVNVNWYRRPNDIDDTACFQRAVATGLAVYMPFIGRPYMLSSDIVMSTPGQIVFGDGRNLTLVWATSNAGFTQGIFVFAAPYCELRDFCIWARQPDTANYSQIIRYVPNVYSANASRCGLYRMALYGCWVGIKLYQNCGGFYGIDVLFSVFNVGIDIDGSLDTVRLRDCHGYPFGLTANQATILLGQSSPVTWVRAGRCDDLKMEASLFIGGLGASFYASASGPSNGGNGGSVTADLTDVSFDSMAVAINMSAGTAKMSGGYISMGGAPAATSQAVILGGGANLTLQPGWMYLYSGDGAGAPNVPWIVNNGGTLTIPNCGDVDLSYGGANGVGPSEDKGFYVQNAGTSNLGAIAFHRTPGAALTNPLINVAAAAGNRTTIIGTRINDQQSGLATTFIKIAADDYHRVLANASPGWTNSFPTGTNLVGVYAYN